AIGSALCPSDPADHQSTERAEDLCPITADHITDDQCSPSSATCQCPSVPALSAHPCHLPAPHQCHISVPISAAFQCHLSMPVRATYQCCQSVPPIS
ncbi:unnamed protein product, partial [Staurois parvus]